MTIHSLDGPAAIEQNIRACVHKQIVTVWLNGDQRGFDDHTDLQHTGILRLLFNDVACGIH